MHFSIVSSFYIYIYIYTQQNKESKHFFKFRFFIQNCNKIQLIIYQIKGNLIFFHPVRKTWRYIWRMSEHNDFSLPMCKSKSCKTAQFAIDV